MDSFHNVLSISLLCWESKATLIPVLPIRAANWDQWKVFLYLSRKTNLCMFPISMDPFHDILSLSLFCWRPPPAPLNFPPKWHIHISPTHTTREEEEKEEEGIAVASSSSRRYVKEWGTQVCLTFMGSCWTENNHSLTGDCSEKVRMSRCFKCKQEFVKFRQREISREIYYQYIGKININAERVKYLWG